MTMTIKEKLEEIGNFRVAYGKTLKKMWEERNPGCREKRRSTDFCGDPSCNLIKNLDHPNYTYCCSFSNCPYT